MISSYFYQRVHFGTYDKYLPANKKMKELKLDNELKTLYQSLAFLWKDYGFHLTYIANGYDGHPHELMIGMESKACKLIFQLGNGSSLKGVRCSVGTRSAWFSTPNYQYSALYDWYPFGDLLRWLGGAPYQTDEHIKTDLEILSRALRLHTDELLELLKEPERVGEKLAQLRNTHGDQDRVDDIQNNQTRPHGGTQ